jgi:hypothetical protein
MLGQYFKIRERPLPHLFHFINHLSPLNSILHSQSHLNAPLNKLKQAVQCTSVALVELSKSRSVFGYYPGILVRSATVGPNSNRGLRAYKALHCDKVGTNSALTCELNTRVLCYVVQDVRGSEIFVMDLKVSEHETDQIGSEQNKVTRVYYGGNETSWPSSVYLSPGKCHEIGTTTSTYLTVFFHEHSTILRYS